MKKIKLEAQGVEPIFLDIPHAERLLKFEKSRGLELWKVTDPNYVVVNGEIKPKSGSAGGTNA